MSNEEYTRATTAPDLLPEGWEASHPPPSDWMTDEANARMRVSVRRLAAPFCDNRNNRQWSGPTLPDALASACKALNLPPPSTGAVPVPENTGRAMNAAEFFAEARRLGLKLPDALELAAREPAPVARDLDVEAERREFEAQPALDDYRPLRRNSEAGNYTSAVVEACWSVWQAARATAESAPASAAPPKPPQAT